MADQTQQIPNEMRRAHGRFERYRKAHTGRRPIPEALWKMAAELADEHDVFRTGKVLRLDYSKLKAQTAALRTKSKGTAPMFVELLPGLPSGSPECLIELDGPRGKMRIQWRGATAADLAGLSRVYFPKFIPHTFRILTPQLRMLIWMSPGGFEGYFRDMSEPARSLGLPEHAVNYGEVDMDHALREGKKRGISFLSPEEIRQQMPPLAKFLAL